MSLYECFLQIRPFTSVQVIFRNCSLIVTCIQGKCHLAPQCSPSLRDPRDTLAETWPVARAGASLGKACIAPKMEEMETAQLYVQYFQSSIGINLKLFHFMRMLYQRQSTFMCL